MKKVAAYLIMIGIFSFCFWFSFVMFSQGDTVGTIAGIGLGVSFFVFFVFIIMYSAKVTQQHQFVDKDYEIVMTQFDSVEHVGEDCYYVHTKWVDLDGGAEYFFRSSYVNFHPQKFLKNKEIPVKISIKDYRIYTVDLSMLPQKA